MSINMQNHRDFNIRVCVHYANLGTVLSISHMIACSGKRHCGDPALSFFSIHRCDIHPMMVLNQEL